jgi:hypothetical protein
MEIKTSIKFISAGEEVVETTATLIANEEVFNGDWDKLRTAGDHFISFVLGTDSEVILEMFKDNHHEGTPYTVQFVTAEDRVIEIAECSMVQWTEANTGRKADRIPTHRGSFCPSDMFGGRGFDYNEKAELKNKFQKFGA